MDSKLVAQTIVDSYVCNGKTVKDIEIKNQNVKIIFTDGTSIEAEGVYAQAIRTGKLFA